MTDSGMLDMTLRSLGNRRRSLSDLCTAVCRLTVCPGHVGITNVWSHTQKFPAA